MSVPSAEDQDTEHGDGVEAETGNGTGTGAAAVAGSDVEDRWRRAVADLDNVRKRAARDLARERAAERARVAGAFLPVLDTIDMALAHADADPGAIVAGVRAVREQALTVLSELGYPRQDDVGVPFDPLRHEVVAVVGPEEAGLPAGVVAAVQRPGYGEPERQLRPATVTVTGGSGR